MIPLHQLPFFLAVALCSAINSVNAALAPTQPEITSTSSTHFIRTLLESTLEVTTHNRTFREKIAALSVATITHEGILEFREKLHALSKESPISLLTECGADSCLLSRKNNPLGRAYYEDRVSQSLLKKLSANHVTYTSFASGGMLQDFIILAKTLTQKPDASIALHLIDHEYDIFISHIHDHSVKSAKITDEIIDTAIIVPENLTTAQLTNATEKAVKIAYKKLLVTKARIGQFKETIKQFFPKAHVDIFMHNRASDYLLYVRSFELQHADILATVDIGDQESLDSAALALFRLLYEASHTVKKDAIGFHLYAHELRNCCDDKSHSKAELDVYIDTELAKAEESSLD